MAERDRIRPTAQGRARLLAAVEAGAPACAVDPGALGEYAALLVTSGRAAADAAFPETASHLQAGCASCPDDLQELLALLQAADDEPPVEASSAPPSPSPSSATPPAQDTDVHPAELRDALRAEQDLSLVTRRPAEPGQPDRSAGAIPHATDLVGPRRRHLTLRDWLLIVAAAIVVLVGVSLIGMAYLASGRGGSAPIAPTVVPAFKPAPPAQPTGPSGQPAATVVPGAGPASTGRAAPVGQTCPTTHPIKGNHESMIYHRPGDEFYDRTRPEDCFATPADAEAAGYRAAQR